MKFLQFFKTNSKISLIVICLYSQTKSKSQLLVQLAPGDPHEHFFKMKIHICELPFKILTDKIIGIC